MSWLSAADFIMAIICWKLFQCKVFPVSSILQALLVIQKSWVSLKKEHGI